MDRYDYDIRCKVCGKVTNAFRGWTFQTSCGKYTHDWERLNESNKPVVEVIYLVKGHEIHRDEYKADSALLPRIIRNKMGFE